MHTTPEHMTTDDLPRHVGVVMDGNRRWARARGLRGTSEGHRRGADHVEDLLAWCDDRGLDHLTVYVLSADNIRKRSPTEVGHLFTLLGDVIARVVERNHRWSLHVSGDLGLLPPDTAAALADTEAATAGRPAHVTMAIGYDGREDIVAGVRAALRSGAIRDAHDVRPDTITRHLPGGPVKEIDLVIRTSGERRLSGFFPWQSAHAEIVLSPKLWPDFDEQDCADALAHYARAGRRTPG